MPYIRNFTVPFVITETEPYWEHFYKNKNWHIESLGCIYPPENLAIVGLFSDLLPVGCQATTWTNVNTTSRSVVFVSMLKRFHSRIFFLTHWGRVTHICIGSLTIIASDNGLSPGRRQAIIWTSAGILLIGPIGTNFSEILIEIITFSFKKMRLKVSSAKWRPFCLGLNMLKLSSALCQPRVESSMC